MHVSNNLDKMEMLDPNEKQRVIIRAYLKSIPGAPLSRPFTLGELFSQKVLGRGLRKQQNAYGFDAIHWLPKFDSENDIVGWFMVDFGVNRHMEPAELIHTQHRMYLAHFDEESQECTFIPRNLSSKVIRYFAALYKWGGSEIDIEIEDKVEPPEQSSKALCDD